MRNPKTVKRLHRELRALLKHTPWVLVSLLLAVVLWRSDTAAISGLFQSPQSPVATATALPPTVSPTEAPTLEPTAMPTVTVPAVVTETAPVTPTLTLTPTATATPLPTDTPVATVTVAPSATPLASPSPTSQDALGESGRYAGEDPALRFEWGMLFDSVALGVSYVWLCCGILLLVSIPVVFVILWVVSKRRQEQVE